MNKATKYKLKIMAKKEDDNGRLSIV